MYYNNNVKRDKNKKKVEDLKMFEFCLMMVNVICYAGLAICFLGLVMILTAMAMDMPRYRKEFVAKKNKKI